MDDHQEKQREGAGTWLVFACPLWSQVGSPGVMGVCVREARELKRRRRCVP